MLRLHRCERCGHKGGPESVWRNDSHGAANLVGTTAGCSDHVFDNVFESGSSGGDFAANGGELPAVGTPIEQANAERGFEPVNAAAHRGVVDAKQGCC